jgi:hypothetical protein
MDIKSLHKQIRRLSSSNDSLFDLFTSTIRQDIGSNLEEYVVQEIEEMRIDLLFQNIYNLSPSQSVNYLEHIDIILTINNIDNPLNIKKGMVIKYPDLGEIDFFRIGVPTDLSKKRIDILGRLGKPNKQTKVDPARQKYLKNDISLPPTVNSTPKSPVTIKNGQFNIGGI